MSIIKDLIVIALICSLFILNNTFLSNTILFILFIIMIILSYKSIFYNFLILKFPFSILILISLILNINVNHNVTEYVRFVTLVFLFLFFPLKVNPNSIIFFPIILGVGIYIYLMQIGSAFGVPQIINFISHYYPIEENRWYDPSIESVVQLNQSGYSGTFLRYGGIYYNPNIMGQFTILWLVLILNMLGLSKFSSNTKYSYTIFFLIIAIISVLFSGSRTALAVLILFIVWYYFKSIINNIYFFIIPIILLLIFYYESILQYRIFSFTQGIYSSKGSISIKLETIKDWINYRFSEDSHIMHIFFGDLSWNAFFDADPGYLLNYFGFLGGFLILWYFFILYYISPQEFKSNFTIMLIGIGATVIFNFRFSILAFIIFSIPFNFNKKV